MRGTRYVAFLLFGLVVFESMEQTASSVIQQETQECSRMQQQQEQEAKRIQEEQRRVQQQQQQEEEATRRQHEEHHKKLHEEAVRRAQEEAKRQQQEQQRQQQQRQRQQHQHQQRNKQEQKPCPYSVLGVGRDATQQEIRSAYRKLAREHHPDKTGGCEKSMAFFTKLVNAYEILGDEDARVMHDEQSFGQYQSRPHSYNSKAGFYNGNSFVMALNQTEFDRLVMCRGPFAPGEQCVPYMIHYYTPWCTHCAQMVSAWKRAASQMDSAETPLGYVQFAGVNCETNKQLCRNKGIQAYPEIQLFAHDRKGQEHMERFSSRRPRSVQDFIDFCEKGVRLAHESTLQSIDATVMETNVTNAESIGLWIVLYEGRNCAHCGSLKASLRRMSANIGNLANFGVLDCDKDATLCQEQYVGTKYPVVKLYPYKGAKGTGETLIAPGADANVLLPVVEKVIRMCLANIQAENGLMKTLHEEEEEYDEPEPPKPQYVYPEPEQQTHRVLPAGVRANGGRQYIGT